MGISPTNLVILIAASLGITASIIIILAFISDGQLWRINIYSEELLESGTRRNEFQVHIENYSRILFFLSSFDLLCGLAYFLSTVIPPNDDTCLYLGVFLLYMPLSKYCITVVMAIEGFLIASRKLKPFYDSRRRIAWYLVFSLLFPVPSTVIPLLIYGRSIYASTDVSWCFLSDSHPLVQLLAYHACAFTLCLACLLFNILTVYYYRKLYRNAPNQLHTQRRNARSYFVAYSITFIFLNVPAMVHRMYMMTKSRPPIYWIPFVHGFFAPLQGFFNAIIFGNTNSIIQRVCKRWTEKLGEVFEDDNGGYVDTNINDSCSLYEDETNHSTSKSHHESIIELEKSNNSTQNVPFYKQNWHRLF